MMEVKLDNEWINAGGESGAFKIVMMEQWQAFASCSVKRNQNLQETHGDEFRVVPDYWGFARILMVGLGVDQFRISGHIRSKVKWALWWP